MKRRFINCLFIIFCFFVVESFSQTSISPQENLTKQRMLAPLNGKKIDSPEKNNPSMIFKKSLIIIDPGHGGHDVGTQSVSKPRYQEKSLNLVTAQFVQSYLTQLGYRVIMTRKDDTFISLDKRAQLANESKPTLFVSIHYNSAPSAEAKGVEVFYYQSHDSGSKQRVTKSKRLAQSILKNVIAQTKAPSRGVKHGNYAVIRETNMPAVLIEGGFLTNEAELQQLKDPTYLKRLAWGIVKGIEDYLKPATQKSGKS
ncbi:MAG: N-acetylmuramoyl-L-alanine amidase [Parachlamydiaceae bacterium]|nr:N-acetylmuramoyl-L-alanine amidase [Parachlamydiaceae bacterium]